MNSDHFKSFYLKSPCNEDRPITPSQEKLCNDDFADFKAFYREEMACSKSIYSESKLIDGFADKQKEHHPQQLPSEDIEQTDCSPVHLEIELDDGKTELLKPRIGDDPLVLATEFCQTHNLDDEMIEYLTRSIEESIRKIVESYRKKEHLHSGRAQPSERLLTEPASISRCKVAIDQHPEPEPNVGFKSKGKCLSSRKNLPYRKQTPSKLSLYQRCIREEGSRKYWIEKEKFAKAQQELKQCTHSPQINSVSTEIAFKKSNYFPKSDSLRAFSKDSVAPKSFEKNTKNRQKSPISSTLKHRVQQTQNKSVFEYLYNESKRSQIKKQKRRQEEFKALRFQPQINNKSKKMVSEKGTTFHQRLDNAQHKKSQTNDFVNFSIAPKDVATSHKSAFKEASQSSDRKYTHRKNPPKPNHSQSRQGVVVAQTKRTPLKQRINLDSNFESIKQIDRCEKGSNLHTFNKEAKFSSIYTIPSERVMENIKSHKERVQKNSSNATSRGDSSSQRDRMGKQLENKFQSSRESEKINDRQKFTAFYWIFRLLSNYTQNSKGEQNLSIDTINLTENVSSDLIQLIFPILEELEILQTQLSLEQFLQAMDKLYKTMSPTDKHAILKHSKGMSAKADNKVKPVMGNSEGRGMNQISNYMVDQMPRKQLSVYEYSQLRQELKEQNLQKERLRKEKQTMRHCTFHPRVNTRKAAYI